MRCAHCSIIPAVPSAEAVCLNFEMIGDLASADSGLPAALLSPGSDFSLPQLAEDGSVCAEANPWLRQFCEDVAEARRCGDVEELPADILQWRDNASLMYSRFRKLLSHKTD